MRVRLWTIGFDGPGHLDCRKCDRRTTFPNGARLILYEYPDIQIVQSARTKVTLHECGRQFYWECDHCGGAPAYEIVARHAKAKRAYVLRCACGGEYKQRPSPTVTPVVEPHPTAATPF